MPNFSGVCVASNLSEAYPIPSLIRSFSLVNKTGGGVTVTVGLIYGSTFDILFNEPLAAAGKFIYSGNDILLPANNRIYIAASGATDFLFSIFPYV